MSKQAFFAELRGEMGELAEYIVQGAHVDPRDLAIDLLSWIELIFDRHFAPPPKAVREPEPEPTAPAEEKQPSLGLPVASRQSGVAE